MTEMRKAYTKPETWATKALFEGPLLVESYNNLTGKIEDYTENPNEDGNIIFNVRQHNSLWEDEPEESNLWSY